MSDAWQRVALRLRMRRRWVWDLWMVPTPGLVVGRGFGNLTVRTTLDLREYLI